MGILGYFSVSSHIYHFSLISIFFNFLNLYLLLREIQNMSRGGAEREGDTKSKAGYRLRAVSTEPDAGLELMNCEIMTWAEVGHLTY